MMNKSYQVFVASIFAVLLLAVSVFAQSDIPHQFAGNVIINGAPAADGSMVVAKVDGKDVAATKTSNGQYGYNPIFLIPDPYRNREGKTIVFYVNGVNAAEFIFENGGQTYLDLSVTISSGGDGNGGGGGNGNGFILTPEPEEEGEETTCTENWQCTEWFECYGSKQSRVCTDINSCGTEDNKPAEEQDCFVKICNSGEKRCDGDELLVCPNSEDLWALIQTCENGCENGQCKAPGFDFTGMFTGLPATVGAVLGLIVIVILGLYFGKIRRK